jgi:hypothetical protein
MLLLLYVSGDLSGLFRSHTLWSIYKLLDEEVLGEEIFSTDSMIRTMVLKSQAMLRILAVCLSGALFF